MLANVIVLFQKPTKLQTPGDPGVFQMALLKTGLAYAPRSVGPRGHDPHECLVDISAHLRSVGLQPLDPGQGGQESPQGGQGGGCWRRCPSTSVPCLSRVVLVQPHDET